MAISDTPTPSFAGVNSVPLSRSKIKFIDIVLVENKGWSEQELAAVY
ncbi:MAG TPA: hypothetical protein VE242_10235 [Chthoniobacterales bacterium]|nr:hypothetical protein [Chthoniobacterales bacterium]